MERLEGVVLQIESLERRLDRRTLLKLMLVGVSALSTGCEWLPPPHSRDHEFLQKVAATLIPPAALAATGIDIAGNVDHLLTRGSFRQRDKIARLLRWSRLIAPLYGREYVAIRSRDSRFVEVQRVGRALASLCLVAFWGDERALALIDAPVS